MSYQTQFMWVLIVQSIVVCAVACVANLLMRRDCNRVHAIALTAILLLLISPFLLLLLPFNGVYSRLLRSNDSSVLVASVNTSADRLSVNEVVTDHKSTRNTTSESASQLQPLITDSNSIRRAAIASEAVVPIQAVREPLTKVWPQTLGVLWAGVIVYLSVLRFIRYRRLRAQVLSARTIELPAELGQHLSATFGREMNLPIRISESLQVPFVFGVIKPSIVVPKNVWSSSEQRRDVVTHEAAHIYRGDPWSHVTQRLVSLLYWWNPLVHVINRQLSDAREMIADNYVLRKTSSVSYSSTLLAIAERCTVASKKTFPSLAFLSGNLPLEHRIQSLLDESRSLKVHSSKRTRLMIALTTVILVCVGGGLGSTTLGLLAQEQSDEPKQAADVDRVEIRERDPTLRTISGRTLDSAGNPVADCMLIAKVYLQDKTTRQIITNSNAIGEYEVSVADMAMYRERVPIRFYAWVYKDGYNLKIVDFKNDWLGTDTIKNFDVAMSEENVSSLTILSDDDRPIPNASIKVLSYSSENSNIEPYEGRDFQLPLEIQQRLQATTNADGLAQLRGATDTLLRKLVVNSKDYGIQTLQANASWSSRTPHTTTYKLSKVGSVRGKVNVDFATDFHGVTLEIKSKTATRGVEGIGTAPLNEKGEFVVHNIAVGDLSASLKETQTEQKFLLTRPWTRLYRGKSDWDLELNLVRTVAIHGTLRLADTHKPIAGQRVYVANSQVENGYASTLTDVDGHFSFKSAPGIVELGFVNSTPLLSEYELPVPVKLQIDSSQEPVQLEPIMCQPHPEFVFHLEDSTGRPIVNQSVSLFSRRNFLCGVTVSDTQGLFRMRLNKTIDDDLRTREMAFYFSDGGTEEVIDSARMLTVRRRSENEFWLYSVFDAQTKQVSK